MLFMSMRACASMYQLPDSGWFTPASPCKEYLDMQIATTEYLLPYALGQRCGLLCQQMYLHTY